ncbi:MAG TPA: hydroxymethylbilane synthase [Chthoniobacterales bacterium]|jgi:hydroxymethylbilane synthase|nr:hydroxymethylbilane synthase [Chthoniobacterales bacterium]
MSAEPSLEKSIDGHRPPPPKIVLGSRGSELARTQTALVVEALKKSCRQLEIATKIISTRGDMRNAEPLDPKAGRKGLFTGEIERALAAGEIDVAVHSAKDLPSGMTPGLALGAVLPRAPVEDVLIIKEAGELKGKVATGSVRRQHQLRWKFPRVEIVDLRGNVPTRLRKFLASDWQAIVLARAGLERLGFVVAAGAFEFESANLHAELLSTDDFLPAGGQGIIALQVRADDDAIVRAIDDTVTFSCLQGEREFLRLLQGDCGSPVGVLATISRSTMTMRAQIFEPSRVEPRTARVEGDASKPEKLARELWEAING